MLHPLNNSDDSSLTEYGIEILSNWVHFIKALFPIEANELLECFQWDEENYDREHVMEELADVIVYCQDMLDVLELDVDQIVNDKMEMNEKKYPVEKAKGNATKYTEM